MPVASSRRIDARLRTRPTLLLGVIAATLLIAALALSVVLAVMQFDGYRWSDDRRVPLDGESHTIAVDADRTALIWRFGSVSNTNCVVVDAATQTEVPTALTDHAYVRDGGMSGAEWVAIASFVPTSDLVELTCPGLQGTRMSVMVEPAPRLPPVLAAYGAAVVIPIGLALAGLATLAWAALTTRNRRHTV